jgi:putative transcriptional regulator
MGAMPDSSTLTGHFLIAMPALGDPNFTRGVTFVCQHSEEGAMGLVVNRASEYKLGDVMAQMQMTCADRDVAGRQVLIGGPVQMERGFVLHAPDERQWDSSFRINDSIAVTTSRDILAAMAEGKGPERALVALGYAGWGEGQLEQELRENAWLTVEANEQILFETALEDRWQAAVALVGVDPNQLSDYAGHA